MKNPKLIVKPFAKNGQKNVIPENYETSMESNQATWDQGFGQITMLPVAAGGLPPKGQDFNGIFNQISENIVYLSQGGRFKFSAEYAEAIGGYPKGAILQSDDEKKEYLSLIDNNKVDFNTATDINASWKLVNTDDLLAQIASKQPKGDYATKTELNSGLAGKQPVGDYATKTEVNSKLDKTAVVQTTGTSTTSVISQKKVTDELNTRASKEDLSSGLSKKVDYGNHTITGGVDSAGNGSVNAANGALRFYRKADGTIGIYSRSEANDTSDYKSEIAFPFGKGEACIDVFTFAAGGVKYRDVKSQRKNGVTYTNTLPRPILVIASYDSPATRTLAYVDGVRVAQTSHGSPSATGAWGGFVSFIVPAGSKYIVNSNGDNITLLDWVEL